MWFGTKRDSQSSTDAAHKRSTIRRCLWDECWRCKPIRTARFGSAPKVVRHGHAGAFLKVNETAGQTVSAIVTPQQGMAVMATEQGRVYETRGRPSRPGKMRKTSRGPS